MNDSTPPLPSASVNAGDHYSTKIRSGLASVVWALFSMRGRMSRTTFLFCFPFVYCLLLVPYLFTGIFGPAASPLGGDDNELLTSFAEVVGVILMIWASWATHLKRAHDFGRGFGTVLLFNLLGLIPYLGLLGPLYFLFKAGDPLANSFGTEAGRAGRPPKSEPTTKWDELQ